jgi:hypothetical protein
MTWNVQKLNAGNLTNGPATVGNPFVSVYDSQQHVGYRDTAGNIWDSFYRPDTGKWNLQQINNGGATQAPGAAYGPFIGVYHSQQHFAFVDRAGNLWDSFYDGSKWAAQKLNAGGLTSGKAALVGGSANFVSIWNDPTNTQQHFTYLGSDSAIYDVYWDSNSSSWHLQQINAGGVTNGPAASSSPYGCVFHSQQHIGYQAGSGDIYDSWYDGNGHWAVQKINNSGVTQGPPAAAGTHPFIWVDPSNTQQHFTYLGSDQAVYDAYWSSNSNSWHLQKITESGSVTNGPGSAGMPMACIFNQQQHIAYRDSSGNLWDSWYDGSGDWALQKINNGTGAETNGGPDAFDPFVWVTGQQQHFTYADSSGTIWDAYWQTPSSGFSFGGISLGDGGDDGDDGSDDGGDDGGGDDFVRAAKK